MSTIDIIYTRESGGVEEIFIRTYLGEWVEGKASKYALIFLLPKSHSALYDFNRHNYETLD